MTRKARPGQQTGILKAAVAAGSLAAALLGTQLLAAQSGAELEQATAVTPEPIIINVPITLPTQPPPAVVPAQTQAQAAAVNSVSSAAVPQIGSGLNLNLAPIPQAVSPQIISPPPRPAAPAPAAPAPPPVTQTKSSK
ncbi:MAG: hypothetical protein HF973_08530 [Chloroflexi bacterium]|nr:hypothetical protein [Chloroflexota bacterium]